MAHDRSYGSSVPATVVFHYAPDRTGARPAEHLKTFCGVLQVDGYAGFEALADKGGVTLAACWAHARRKFFELHEAGSPGATETVQRIGELYEIEATIRGRPPDERLRVRQQQSVPLVEVLQAWLDLQLSRLPGRSRLAEAIRYALGRWSALTRFLDDGRIDLDNNPVEQRRDLLEIMDDRHGKGSTIVTSQVPVDHWHEVIGDPTIADAILDRLVHNAHRLVLKGESLRKQAARAIMLDAEGAA